MVGEPTLEMLWERADAPTVLRERFGLADAATVARHLTRELEERWGLSVRCERVVLSDQNLLAWVRGPDGSFVVKACAFGPLFPRLDAVTRVVSILQAQGVPVAAPIPTAVGGPARVVVEGAVPLSVVVLPLVRAEHLDPTDPDAVRATGAVVARMHRVLASLDVDLPGPVLPPHAAQVGARPVLELPAASAGRVRLPAVAARLDALVSELPDLDTRPSLVHGDVRGANVLVRDGEVAALLDHDSMGLGHRVQDLARAAVTVATRFRTWDPPPRGAVDHLIAGYRSVLTLSDLEERWLEACLLFEGLAQIPAGPDPAGWADAVERGF